jgi:hypothetical protein
MITIDKIETENKQFIQAAKFPKSDAHEPTSGDVQSYPVSTLLKISVKPGHFSCELVKVK